MNTHEELRDIVDGILPRDAGSFELTQSPEDLGFDSLDIVELEMAVEEEFDIEIPDEEMEKFFKRPLNELAHYIDGELESHG